MADTSTTRRSQATGSPHPHPRDLDGTPPEVVRLANRTALFTFVAAFTIVLGLVLLLRTVAAGGPVLIHLAAALPFLAAAATILYLRRLRADLRRARQRDGPLTHAPRSNAPGERSRA